MTLEQEEEDASWLNSEVEVCILQKLPTTSSERIWAHLHDQTHDIAKLTTLEMPAFTTNQQFKRTVTTTGEITSSLRRVNTTDPFLPSTRMTPNHEFAIVPRRTAPLPLNEHKLSVEQLINAAIVDFHLKHHRLPHKITIAAIRYLRYRISIDTYDPNIFYYDNIPIPITSAPIGDFGIDEVWLD